MISNISGKKTVIQTTNTLRRALGGGSVKATPGIKPSTGGNNASFNAEKPLPLDDNFG